MAGLQYAISTFLCIPTALAQHGPHVLGAMAGAAALRDVLQEAGFSQVERVAPDAPSSRSCHGFDNCAVLSASRLPAQTLRGAETPSPSYSSERRASATQVLPTCHREGTVWL